MATSKAQLEAAKRYLDKQDEIRIRLPQGQKDLIKKHAQLQGESMNAFIVRAIVSTIASDNSK